MAIRRELKGFGVPKETIVASREEIEQKRGRSSMSELANRQLALRWLEYAKMHI